MSNDQNQKLDPNAPAGLTNSQLQSLIESIAQMARNQQEANEAGPIKQIPISKTKIQTPWNPSGNKKRPVLRRVTWLNGYRLREIMLSDREIELLNQLRSGRYNNNRWTVIEAAGSTITEGDGPDAKNGEVSVFVPNKTQADRLRLKGEAPDLETLLMKMIDEQKKVVLASR